MSIISFFHTYSEVINGLSNIFMALGTVSAVIVALWLSFKDNKPRLKVFATVGVITPEMSEHLWVSCINVGKQPITCNSFSFAPKVSKSPRIMPIRKLDRLCVEMPKMIGFSEKIDQHFDASFFSDSQVSNFLGRYRWLAKIKLKLFWRVVINTNVGEFTGGLSSHLIDKILSSQFPSLDLANPAKNS